MTDIDEARRQGEQAGANRYLREIVGGRIERATGRTTEEVTKLLEHVDPTSFTDEHGDVDGEKVAAFAATVGGQTGGGVPHDPVAAALSRVQSPAGGNGSSIQIQREKIRDNLTKGKKHDH